jgi:Domain of unknown function (DUF4760)
LSQGWSEFFAQWEHVASICASLAVILTAGFIYLQWQVLRKQLLSGDSNHFDNLMQTSQVAKDHMATTRSISSQRAMLDVMMSSQTNEHWIKMRSEFITLRDSPAGLEKYANGKTTKTLSIRKQLNQYELIAIGIAKGILDKEMFRDFYRGTFIRDHIAARNFIKKERDADNNQRFWIELEKLAKEFEGERV